MKRLTASVMMALCLAVSSVAMAQTIVLPPPVDHSGSQKGQQKVNAAQQAQAKAETALIATLAKLRKGLEQKPEYMEAFAAHQKAVAEFEAASKPILAALKEKAQYAAACENKRKAQEKLDELKSSGSASMADITAGASEVMELGKMLTKMEADALGANSVVGTARDHMLTAAKKLASVKAELEKAMKDDSELAAARKAIDDAKAQVTVCRKDLSLAIQNETQLELQRNQQIVALQRAAAARSGSS